MTTQQTVNQDAANAITTPETVFNAQPLHVSTPAERRSGVGLSTGALIGIAVGVLLTCAVCFFAGMQVGKNSAGSAANGFGPGGNGQMGMPPDMSGDGSSGSTQMPGRGGMRNQQQQQDSEQDLQSSTVQ